MFVYLLFINGIQHLLPYVYIFYKLYFQPRLLLLSYLNFKPIFLLFVIFFTGTYLTTTNVGYLTPQTILV